MQMPRTTRMRDTLRGYSVSFGSRSRQQQGMEGECEHIRVLGVQILFSHKLAQCAMRDVVDRAVDQTRFVEPGRIPGELDCRRHGGQAVMESRSRCAAEGLVTEALGLLVHGVSVGLAVLLDAVRHGLKPSRVVRAAVVAGHAHGHAHAAHVVPLAQHLHAGHVVVAMVEGGAAQVQRGERVVAGLAAEVGVHGEAEAEDAILGRSNPQGEGEERKDEERG